MDAAVDELAALRQAISDAFLFATSAQSAEQLGRAEETLELTRQIQEAEQQRAASAERTEARARSLQQTVTLIAALFLGPGLVAAGFGAFPDFLESCQLARFAAMLALMAVSAVATFFVVNRREDRGSDTAET